MRESSLSKLDSVERDNKGFLLHPEQWTVTLAEEQHQILDDHHW